MLLPQRCLIIKNGRACSHSPSFVVSINDKKDQYMIGVVCKEHMDQIEKRLESMQEIGNVPNGAIEFQHLNIVSTNCIRGSDEDYMEVESKRKYNNI